MVTALYELIVRYVCSTVPMLNRFHYALTEGENNLQTPVALVMAFQADVLNSWAALVTDTVQFQSITAFDLYSPLNLYEDVSPAPAAGASFGDPMPPHDQLVFRTPRLRVGSNRGHKYFAGFPESNQSAGLYTGAIPAIEAMESALGNTITSPAFPTMYFTPAVLFLEKVANTEPPPAPPFVYRRYPTFAQQEANMRLAEDWNFDRISTNKRRKREG